MGRGLKVALTGGIGCGKSEAGRLFRKRGAAVSDADDLVHGLLRRGTPEFRKIVRRFGRSALNPAGEIDRAGLAARVFADARERAALEAILHPPVMRRLAAWCEARARRGQDAVAIVPLLFEAGFDRGWDATICVAAARARVLARLKRKGMREADARARMAAQMPLSKKTARADFVIGNNGTRASLEKNVRRVWAELRKRKGKRHGLSKRT